MKSTTIGAAAFLTVLSAIPAAAQRPKPAGKITVPSAADARVLEALKGARDPVSMETVVLSQDPRNPKRAGPDLTVGKLDFDGEGRIRYTAVNNTFGETVNPFVADILIDDERKDTIKHPPLPVLTAHAVTTATRFPDCATHRIRVQLDAQQIVTETAENNNDLSESATPPCPDLAVTEIKKNWQDGNTRFRTHVTIQNLGDRASPAGIVLMINTSGDLSKADNDYITLEALQPGQSRSFTVGDAFLGTSTAYVTAFVDFYKLLVEKDEENNYRAKTI